MQRHFLAFALSILAIAVSAQPTVLENTWFSEKGVMGRSIVEETDRFHLSADTRLSWNNRRYSVEESVVLDAHGYPVKIVVSGISAFGAPVRETFERADGTARWNSLKESGQSTEDGFYLPADYQAATLTALVRAIQASDNRSVKLLPRGYATAKPVATQQVRQGESRQTVTLYALEGLDLMPEYLWLDQNLSFFASGEPALGAIRKGFDIDVLRRLSDAKNEQEKRHMTEMAKRLSETYDSLLLSNLRVIDVEKLVALEGQDVLLENGRIKAVSSHPSNLTAERSIDASGKTLIPGLWDMHGHLSNQDGALYLAAGVTSVRDMGTAHESIMRIEDYFHSGEIMGPNIYRAGFMDQFSEYSAGLSVKSLDQAHDKIDFFADNGYRQLKLYSSISPEWVPELVEHAHDRGMRVSGHIPAFMNAGQAVDAGFDEIQHINMVFLNFLGGESIDTRQQLRFSIPAEQAHQLDLDSEAVETFIAKLVRNRVVIDPTLATFRSMYTRRAGSVDPEFSHIAPNLPPQYVRSLFLGAEMDIPKEQLDDYKASADAFSAMVKKLHDAGVWIVPGTDHGGLGLALQQELIDYALAGIDPIEVLQLATLGSAKLVGAAHRTGSISAGKDADLVLLEENPLDNMRALSSAVLVVKGNKLYQPAELYEGLNIVPFAGRLPGHKPAAGL